MIKLEIKNIIDENDVEIPRLELWLTSPRQMIVESSAVIEYMSEAEFITAWKKLSERKRDLEIEHNLEVSNLEVPRDYKKELKNKVEKLMSKIDEVTREKETPKSRVLN